MDLKISEYLQTDHQTLIRDRHHHVLSMLNGYTEQQLEWWLKISHTSSVDANNANN